MLSFDSNFLRFIVFLHIFIKYSFPMICLYKFPVEAKILQIAGIRFHIIFYCRRLICMIYQKRIGN
jgi:hypothetical protein